jgi:hypothetical protein
MYVCMYVYVCVRARPYVNETAVLEVGNGFPNE